MNYTTEQLQEIEQCAALYMRISDIAYFIGVTPHVLRADISQKGSEPHMRYHKGKTTSLKALREQEMTLAKIGSPLAIQNCRDNLIDMEEDE